MRLVHISDVHVYDPDSRALQRARHWGKVAIAAGVFAGVM
jgi:3',5'-cyclic AMP phosphodiesterase CpdA